jgi:hypothetical protein
MNQTEHTATLKTGFTEQGATHKTLVFGHRVIGRDLLRMDRLLAGSDTRVKRECALYRQALTQFGELPADKWLHALLSLNTIDRAKVTVAFNEFHRASAEGRAPAKLSIETLRLGWPVKREEQLFDTVIFGRLLTGYDELEAESLSGTESTFFLKGRMIARLASSEGEQVLEGPFDQALFRDLDFEDIIALNEAADEWEAEQLQLARPDVDAQPEGTRAAEESAAV